MIVYVVNVYYREIHSDPDLIGVYSNLALAGRALMQYFEDSRKTDNIIVRSFMRKESWGYSFDLYDSPCWELGWADIIKVTMNE